MPIGVPVEQDGGPGTRDGHWDEQIFQDEIATGFVSGAARPLSRMTIASLADLGYAVDLEKADAYVLPPLSGAESGMRRKSLLNYKVKRPGHTTLPGGSAAPFLRPRAA